MTSLDIVQLADYAFLVLVIHEILMRDTSSSFVSDTGLAKIPAPVMIGSDSGLLPAKIVQGFILAYVGHKLLQEMGVLTKQPSSMAMQKRALNRKRASRAMGCGMPSSSAMEVVPGRVEPQSVIME